jgi:uncharacterized membrane protein
MMRTFAKTITYAAMHLTVAIAVAYAISGDWAVALSIGILEPLVQTLFFAGHEKLWERKTAAKRPAGKLAPA